MSEANVGMGQVIPQPVLTCGKPNQTPQFIDNSWQCADSFTIFSLFLMAGIIANIGIWGFLSYQWIKSRKNNSITSNLSSDISQIENN